jgi:hypothetical protein
MRRGTLEKLGASDPYYKVLAAQKSDGKLAICTGRYGEALISFHENYCVHFLNFKVA